MEKMNREEKLLSWFGVLLLWSRGEAWVTDDAALDACLKVQAYVNRVVRLLASEPTNKQ